VSEPQYQKPDLTLLGEEHLRRYQETDGEVGYIWNGAAILLLTTTGRKTQKPRTIPIIFSRDGDDYLIVGSRGGAPKDPDWVFNLRAKPEAEIQVRAEHIRVVGRIVTGPDKGRLWKIMTEVWPNYDVYQTRTDRDIPVAVLSPA
jgi:deazaflavin-dependent oxidoreductase (nitroreductase family)